MKGDIQSSTNPLVCSSVTSETSRPTSGGENVTILSYFTFLFADVEWKIFHWHGYKDLCQRDTDMFECWDVRKH
jgi:hypothetical protein